MTVRQFIFLVFFFPIVVLGQTRDTTIISVDSVIGIKKIIHYEFIGTGGGYAGSSPHLTKTTITKYDKSGKIIYLSHKTFRLRGCIGDTPHWDITASDSSGGQRTLKLKRKKLVIKSFDKNGKLISTTYTNWTSIKTLDWIDKDDYN